jgi:hypothetical protein
VLPARLTARAIETDKQALAFQAKKFAGMVRVIARFGGGRA